MAKDMQWSKFFWNDWRGDPCLRACSLAARGLWMEMLCLAAEAPRYGHCLIAYKQPTISDLSRIAGENEGVVELLLQELEQNGVFSRLKDGTIYCRRMVREKNISAKRQKAGKLGGNPTLCKIKGKTVLLNQEYNLQLKHKKLEARSQIEKNYKKRKSALPEDWTPKDRHRSLCGELGYDCQALAEHFSEHHRSRGNSFADWDLAFFAWIRRRKDFLRPAAYPQRGPPPKAAAEKPDAMWRRRAEAWRKHRLWIGDYGPPPGEPGCQCPAELLMEAAQI